MISLRGEAAGAFFWQYRIISLLEKGCLVERLPAIGNGRMSEIKT
ncbi:MAG: hypothetical protein ACI9Y1_000960 [Lentisphaeria bacterium]|jgi:hypothetical protein